ncbi:HEPN domain-containing protein [Autumnicola edwardsiae]|uniref:HEPN domain-containing protein n=1 Tax=Autumnicola edwardsiae TaxID=3075594 RepID=A0ABU3CZA0_9FLAO|nr:HEPN domain-containing protein [Zunongwangia sp. F297]MDT0651698.1 HEPN domain-containing protein [Zunongwangia sp. F297]
MKPVTQSIIRQLIEILAIKAIYVIPFIEEAEKQLFLVIKKGADSINNKLISVTEIFQEHPQFVYRIYEETYAIEQLKEGNIFFLQGFLIKYLKYGALKTECKDWDFKEALQKTETLFKKEYTKALDFQQGANFYIEKENYPQAAFMFHQSIELSFRTVELITMGKEKICHGITYHQKYIQNFVPELGHLFSKENEQETQLLDLLDTAYRNVRYDRDYEISLKSIKLLQNKLDKMLKIVENEFEKRHAYCKNPLESTSTEKETLSDKITANPRIKYKVQEFFNRKLYKLEPGSEKLYYKAEFKINGIADVLYDIAGIMKVCIVALEYADSSYGRLIPQPHINVQTALEHILQLLPFEEVETLEEIINNYNIDYENQEKETAKEA